MSKNGLNLREGFTTGSAATAAAMAALKALLGGNIPYKLEIPLPVKGTLQIPIDRVEISGDTARGVVVKDGGDDPDATHGQEIHAVVRIRAGEKIQVHLSGGEGVGTVTRPGLPVQVGEAAINPAPRRQIISGVLQELSKSKTGFRGSVMVRIEVPRGREIAEKTMNARLGIMGGISILGTQGIVRPFSHSSWKASIAQALNVARASGLNEIIFSTGRRSECFFLDRFPDTDRTHLVQAADFFKFSMLQAKAKRMRSVRWALFIGKLIKHAQGFPYTHAKDWAIDFSLLGDWAAQLGMDGELVEKIRSANTGRQVFEMLPQEIRTDFIDLLVEKARQNAAGFAGKNSMEISYCLFDFEGRLLTKP